MSAAARRSEGVADPAAGVVDDDVDRPELRLGRVEQHRDRGRIGQIGFDGDAFAAERPERGDHVVGTGGALLGVLGRDVTARRIGVAQERDEHIGTELAEPARRGGADPVIGTGDDGDAARQG